MNDDANADKRRARLRAMRERYGQRPADLQETGLAVNESAVDGGPQRARNRSGRPERLDGREQAERKGGGPLQRLVQFLMEPSHGDTLIPGTQIGEQRLRQAVGWLEQRSRTTQGAAGERIQRLLRFLKQDIPGEPVVAGVNLKRLQQLMERVETTPASIPLAANENPEAGSADRAVQPLLAAAEPAPVAASKSVPAGAETESADEIAIIEETLQRLRDITRDLERHLDEARQQGKTTPGRADARRQHSETAEATRISVESVRPSSEPRLQTGSESRPRPEGDDWFLEFLE
ncbi:MAG TPA: hypothetical protein PKY50_03700 [Candidatus Competibacter sp.]|nr:hypothetical protein [Candidatus Competibacter sp.]